MLEHFNNTLKQVGLKIDCMKTGEERKSDITDITKRIALTRTTFGIALTWTTFGNLSPIFGNKDNLST